MFFPSGFMIGMYFFISQSSLDLILRHIIGDIEWYLDHVMSALMKISLIYIISRMSSYREKADSDMRLMMEQTWIRVAVCCALISVTQTPPSDRHGSSWSDPLQFITSHNIQTNHMYTVYSSVQHSPERRTWL